MRKIAVLIVLCITAGTAAAQPSLTAPSAPPPPFEVSRGDELSPGTALALSLGGTLASYGLIIASMDRYGDEYEAMALVGGIGTFVAPSFGHWYEGTILTRGLGFRALGAGTFVTAAMVALSECPLFSEQECNESPAAPILAIAGAAMWVGGTVDDIIQAPRRARRHNARLRGVTLAPMATRGGGGGLVVAGSF
jgi:hypothetical protein